MRVSFAQIDPVVGAFESNLKKIEEAYLESVKAGARVLVTPELSICGYPPHDLVRRPEMYEKNEKALSELIEVTRGKKTALLVGHIAPNPLKEGRPALNTVSVLENGNIVFQQAKTLLPTYDVFDEARYFEPAREVKLWECDGKKIAVGICEDLWGNDPAFGRKRYLEDPVEVYASAGPDLLISVSASPYEWKKRARREEIHGAIVQKLGVPLVYVNQVGATDEILFGGWSFVQLPGSEPAVLGRLPAFKNAVGTVELDLASKKGEWISPQEREDQVPEEIEIVARGLIRGIREYFLRTGFEKAILGISGGIDSAVVATLAKEALGAENVLGLAMPGQYSSTHSIEDAEKLAKNLGIRFQLKPIKFQQSVLQRELGDRDGSLAEIAQENLQARLRGIAVMTLANHHGALALATGNKSELAMGYSTLYGDMVGALSPIGDLYKMRVYDLARFLNEKYGQPIPERTLTKAPSAELKPNQKDQDTLPPYEILDPLLEDYLEKAATVADLIARHEQGSNKGWVVDVLRRLELNEYKRRQAAPILKLTSKAFGIGRRIPIAKTWTR